MNFSEFNYRKAKFDKHLVSLNDSKDTQSLRESWKDCLDSFAKCIGWLISSSIANLSSRAWGYQLKQLSTKDDEGLVFLREARNHVHHGLTPFAGFQNPVASASNFISIGGDCTVRFTNVSFSGPDGHFSVEDGIVETKSGRLTQTKGIPRSMFKQHDAKIILVDIVSSEKGQVFTVPNSLAGIPIHNQEPITLLNAARRFLEAKAAELETLND